MSLHPGTRLGPYEVLSSLGAGGMGVVYRARDSRLGRDVAIKALPDPFARDPERLQRFEREAKVLASLSHPHIAAIYGLEEVEGHRYLVLEYVEGPTLAERLKKGPLPLTEALEVCRDIAAGLEAAHESGVIHRDLKPGNVMLTPSGGVKVLDFGLAKGGTGSNSESNLMDSPTLTTPPTGAGVILGTAAYMSPEQARGKAVDRRTDIWSFGCVLYECLTGKQAFEGETVSDLIAKILEREPDWSALPASVPPRVVALLRRCLTKDAKQRLRDIGDARLELTEVMTGPAEPAASAVPGKKRSARLDLALAVIAALAGVIATKAFDRISPHAPRPMRVSVQAPDGMQVSDEVPDVTISPDGSMLLFAGQDTAGVSHLWVRPLASAGSRMLPGTEGAKIPFWAPNGREVAFFAGENLKRIPIDGETAQIICKAPNPRGGAWGAGDVVVFAPTASGPLMQVPASGGEPRPATTLDTARGETAHRFPDFLPDGKRFLYVALPGKANQLETRVGTLDARPGPVVVTSSNGAVYAEPGYLLFTRQGSVVAQRFDARSLKVSGAPRTLPDLFDASASYSGSPALMSSDGILVQREAQWVKTRLDMLDRSGRTLSTISLPDGKYSTPRFSPDGSHLVLDSTTPGTGAAPLWMVELARGTSSRFTFEGLFENSATWTPDGSRVIFGGERTAGRDIYWKRADGSGAEELLADAPGLFNDPNDVSPDGKVLVYRSLSGETSEDIWMLPLAGDRKPAPLIRTRFNEIDAAISPDGRWIAYRSDESGRFEIYIQSFPALDRKIRVTTDGAQPLPNAALAFTRWRRDGRELFFVGSDGQTIMSAAVEPGADLRVATPRPLLRVPRGTIDADVSPDGQRILACMPTGTHGRSVLNLVMNWAAEPKESK